MLIAEGAQIPIERRPLAFATTELILDLLYVARDRFSGDYERMWIYFCTAHARESGVTRREIGATRRSKPTCRHGQQVILLSRLTGALTD